MMRKKKDFTEILPDGTAFEMVFVERGSFDMGAAKGDPEDVDWSKKNVSHPVTLNQDYYIGKYPVTQAQYQAIMGNNPSDFKGENRPVENVSWFDAVLFCNTLSQNKEKEGIEACYFSDAAFMKVYDAEDHKAEKEAFLKPTAQGFRLPTEAQWEYAARGGKYWEDGFKYAGSNKLKEVAWFDKNSHGESKPVGLKYANPLGIHDMSGNVWEWCNDWLDEDYYQKCLDEKRAVFDPMGAESGSRRVRRGGSWFRTPQACRVACRNSYHASLRYYDLGFRLCFLPVRRAQAP